MFAMPNIHAPLALAVLAASSLMCHHLCPYVCMCVCTLRLSQVGGVLAGALYIAIEEMQFPGSGSRGGGLFVG